MTDNSVALEDAKRAYENASRSADRVWDKFHELQEAESIDTEASTNYFRSDVFAGAMLYLISMQQKYIEALENAADGHDELLNQIKTVLHGHVMPGTTIVNSLIQLVQEKDAAHSMLKKHGLI